MVVTADQDVQRRRIRLAHQRADISVDDLWLRYFALGGVADALEVEAYLHGMVTLPATQRDMLAHAVNERLHEVVRQDQAPYSRAVDAPPLVGPLAALVRLLDDTRGAPPERLCAVASAAGQALGVGVTIYLVDYGQRVLIPLSDRTALPHGVLGAGPSGAGESGAGLGEPPVPLAVEATLAGRAFRDIRTMPSLAVDPPRLWVPLLDGVERLGVLDVRLTDRAATADPALREQCRWLADLIGHLVTIMSETGDALDVARRIRPRTAAAELIWNLLPPLTSATDGFVVAGMLEPSHDVGGDAFDYALSQSTAHLAVLDATGHSLAAGLVTSAALAAYRNARRGAGTLTEQCRAIDRTVAQHFGAQQRYVTAFLAELDLASGRLRYVNAGHPAPLLLRGGKVVATLTRGGRPLLGYVTEDVTVAEETLEPGDLLALYTDGITEARDDNGEQFGTARLADFLHREAATGCPTPEVARRLTHAVMDHQHGVLQDDATILLARWDGSAPSIAAPE